MRMLVQPTPEEAADDASNTVTRDELTQTTAS